MLTAAQPALTAPLIPAISPDDPHVRAVRETVAGKLAKVARDNNAVRDRDADLFAIGFGLVSGASSSPRGVSFFSRMVRGEDWAPIGYAASRARRRPGGHQGYMRAELVGGAAFEAYAADGAVEVTGLYRDGRPIGSWRSIEYSYEGRFRQPLARELWSGDRRLGIVDTALLTSGSAVLEIDPEGHPVIPLRIKRAQVINGNPFAEIFKATPFGKRLGPRRPNLDLVLAPQAAWLAEPADQALVFTASLALRTLICGSREVSSD